MKSTAAGQLLGYSLQFSRALYHLLISGPGDKICVEVLGDVTSITADGKVTAEEDKSSTTSNPLTDKSTDIWKTFYNWIEAINDGELDINKTKFILYCNQTGRSGIVNAFSAAQNKKDAKTAVADAKKSLVTLKSDHPIWQYYNFVMNHNEALLIKIIERFELQIGSGTGYDEVRNAIRTKIVPESQIDFLLDLLVGWLHEKILLKISAREHAIISWDEFNKQFLIYFQRVRRRELIDFTLQDPPQSDQVQHQVKIRPIYLRQLEAIGISDDDILEAVSDFLRAKVNRDKWIEDQLIDEELAADFESKLKSYWSNQAKRIEIVHKKLDEKERGQLLFFDCRSRKETIGEMPPPAVTIAGTYHALADKPTLGWHLDWEKKFKDIMGK